MEAPSRPATGSDLAAELLRRAEGCRPADLADIVVEVARETLGAGEVVLYVVTHEQTELVPLPVTGSSRRTPQPVIGSGAGESFVSGTVVQAHSRTAQRLFLPLVHDGLRVGVLEVELPEAHLHRAGDLARLVAQLIVTKQALGDDVESVRRTQLMTVGAELLASVLPPLSVTTARVSIAALLEPSYSSGGDAFDYAVNGDLVHLAILDATGHGFAAAVDSTIAIAGYRTSRRADDDLVETYRAMDAVVGEQASEGRFVTAALAELDTTTGRLTWLSAGHAPPLVVRRDGDVVELTVDPMPPLGVGLGLTPEVQEEFLEPGDLLVLYTDGISEARDLAGAMLGVGGLADLVRREAAGRRSLPEMLRRMREELLSREDVWLSDDATAVLVQWHGTD